MGTWGCAWRGWGLAGVWGWRVRGLGEAWASRGVSCWGVGQQVCEVGRIGGLGGLWHGLWDHGVYLRGKSWLRWTGGCSDACLGTWLLSRG